MRHRIQRQLLLSLVTALLALSQTTLIAQERRQSEFIGWRCNTTGLFPDATPVVEWGRAERGVVSTLKISADRPADDSPGDAAPLRHNWPRTWLLIGPFEAPEDASPDERLDKAYLDEANVRPAAGDKVGESAWTPMTIPDDVNPPYERGSVAGTTDLTWVRLGEVLKDLKANTVAYAHTYLYAEKDGEAEIIVDHGYGLKAFVNGTEVYRELEGKTALGGYTFLGKMRATFQVSVSPRFRVKLNRGWNRLLFKLSPRKWIHVSMFGFNARIVDLPDAPAEEKNILWAAPLPDRSNATPIIVKDRIFVMAEPEQIICLDKKTGKQLWTRFLGLYEATPRAERDANPAFREKVEPLVAKLAEPAALEERMALRKRIYDELSAIDREKYALKWDGHMQSHFRIVGWTVGTPASDGESVYVWCGNGVAASFDLDGNTHWIRRANPGVMYYPASPAVIDGKFIVFASGGFNMVALDARTGEEAWRQPAVYASTASLIPARINGVAVVIEQRGAVVRVSDGKMVHAHPRRPAKYEGDTGWNPPVCINNVIYQPWGGIGLFIIDFNGKDTTGDAWTADFSQTEGLVVSKNSKGQWIDRWSCGSPLIHEDIYYNVDIFGTLYAADLATKKLLYRVDLSGDFDALSHYNAVGVAASVTLGGRHLFVMDNQGNCVVFEPGGEFKKVAVNRIQRTVRRPFPMRPQEETGYSPPVFEGPRMYLRGEHYLYCIGRE